MNIFLVHHRSPHHANNSGYGRLMDYTNAKVVYGNTKFPFRIAKILAGFHSQNLGNYNVGSVLKAIELFQLLKKHKGQKNIVHFLNGERDIRHLGFFKRKFPNTKFCATFHKPPKVLKETISNPKALQKLDGVVAVGANQVGFLKDWLQLGNVFYIPHGVDTAFFVPNTSVRENNSLLFVGQHLRDFDTFNKSVPRLAAAIASLQIRVVIHPAYRSKIEPHSCVDILSDVNDEQLRTLYQQATLLYLPLMDSTACNSLLEAMACGLPIITTNVGGNANYLKNTSNILIESGNIDGFIDETIALLQDEPRLTKMGKASRDRAVELEWEKVMRDINGFYEKLS
ncbi:MAG TPA: glycosyltransferase family 4 protein [Flavobacteriaceae bacterium]|nr:glycosyltransferase family 4 protein [Flavobacteriaceae bacterium]